MQVITNRQIKSIDWKIFDSIGDDIDVNNVKGNLIFSYEFYIENRDSLLSRSEKTGVILNGKIPVEAIISDLDKLDLIALDFTNYVDGRCFSHARLLKDSHKFHGKILAIGDILRDQVAHLERCGVDLIKLTDHRDKEDALKAFSEFSTPYQASQDNLKTIPQSR